MADEAPDIAPISVAISQSGTRHQVILQNGKLRRDFYGKLVLRSHLMYHDAANVLKESDIVLEKGCRKIYRKENEANGADSDLDDEDCVTDSAAVDAKQSKLTAERGIFSGCMSFH